MQNCEKISFNSEYFKEKFSHIIQYRDKEMIER